AAGLARSRRAGAQSAHLPVHHRLCIVLRPGLVPALPFAFASALDIIVVVIAIVNSIFFIIIFIIIVVIFFVVVIIVGSAQFRLCVAAQPNGATPQAAAAALQFGEAAP